VAKVTIRPPKAVADDGYGLPDATRTLKGFALLSLRIAMRAYFSTYKDSHTFHTFAAADYEPGEKTDFHHSTKYYSLYGQTIVHFQHFAELVCKDILRAKHDLLVFDAASKSLLLDMLLQGDTITAKDYEQINSVEFSTALNRLADLLDANRLDARYHFFRTAKPFLQQLNSLRNRLLHRGTYVLRYRALDEFVGAYVFPFVKQVVAQPEYSNQGDFWRHKPLKCGIDPMDTITAEWAKGEYDVKKVALLKELGRAAYESPADDDPMFVAMTTRDHERVERRASAEVEQLGGAEVRDCPVCGLKAFVVYEDFEAETDDYGNPVGGRWYPYLLRCSGCTLEIDGNFANPSEYGLVIHDFWK
jgi:hypothetical protein